MRIQLVTIKKKKIVITFVEACNPSQERLLIREASQLKKYSTFAKNHRIPFINNSSNEKKLFQQTRLVEAPCQAQHLGFSNSQ